jgi:hypothetical protein
MQVKAQAVHHKPSLLGCLTLTSPIKTQREIKRQQPFITTAVALMTFIFICVPAAVTTLFTMCLAQLKTAMMELGAFQRTK